MPLFMVCGFLLLLSFSMSLYRVLKGPGFVNRAAGLDVATSALVGFFLITTFWNDQARRFLDVALVLAACGFFAPLILSRVMKREREELADD